MVLLTLFSWFIPEPGPNELSHVDLVYALVRDGTTRIDPYHANTIDRSHHEGHFYTNKAPGLALMAAPVLWAADLTIHPGPFGATRLAYVSHLLTVAAVSLPAALMAPLLAATARRLGAGTGASLVAATLTAIGTAMLPFSTLLYSHATATALGFAAWAFAVGALLRGHPTTRLLLAGLCAGYAVTVEYPSALVGAVLLAFLVLRRTGLRPLLAFVGGGSLGVLPLLVYNWASFGAPWRLSYAYTDFDAFSGMRAGLFGVTLPTVDGLAEILIGPSGLFTQSPFLLLAPLGLLTLGRRHRLAALTAGSMFVAFALYNAGFWAPSGGQSSGPRYLLPAVPFLGLGLAFLPGWLVAFCVLIAPYSVLHVLAIAAVEPKTGPGHANAFVDYWVPRLRAGDIALSWAELRWGLRGWRTLVPLAVPGLIGVGLATGTATLGRGRRSALAAAAGLVLALIAWVGLVAPVGRAGVPAQLRATAPDAPSQLRLLYGGGLEFLGYRLPDGASPGAWVDVELFWRAPQGLSEPWTGFVQLVDAESRNVAGVDGPPGGAGFPTEMWRAGETVRAVHRLRVTRDIAAPQLLQLVVGVYGPGKPTIAALDARGADLGHGPRVASLALRPAPPIVDARPARATFEGGIELLDWTLPEQVRAGTSAPVSFRWRAVDRPARDATVFVQLLGATGPIAQADAQPLRGHYPTSAWRAGEIVDDAPSLSVPAGTAAGDYPVIAGLYLLPEVRRLGVGGADHVRLGTLRVEG